MSQAQKIFQELCDIYNNDKTEENRKKLREYVNKAIVNNLNIKINASHWFTLQTVMKGA